MRCAITADLHVMYKGHALTVNGIPESIYFPLYNLINIVDNKDKYNIDTLIIAGDLIEEKSNLHQIVLNELMDTLKYCSNKIETHIIAGNHDYIRYHDNTICFLENIEFCNVVLPGKMDIIGDIALIAHGTKEEMNENFTQLDPQAIKLLISHFSVSEGIIGNGVRITGMYSAKDFELVDNIKIILGDYHKPQDVSKNITYVGSPVPVDRAERYDEKRFIIYDTETDEIESIPTIYPRYIEVDVGYDKIEAEKIMKDIQDNLNKYILNIPFDYPYKKDIRELSMELPGYIFVEVGDRDTSNNIDDRQTDAIEKFSLLSVSKEYLLKKGIQEKDIPDYLKEVEPFIK